MKKRQVYIIAGAVGIFLIARLISDLLGTPPERRAAPPKSNITTVFSQEVKTGKIPVLVESTGLIEAVERVELY
ncbi:MAG: hypothetical protein HKO93_05455, partial [Flavobacteriales bacterium]|nr:hypothetical protein [Flavobacteriales bacterium]